MYLPLLLNLQWHLLLWSSDITNFSHWP
jgi:hypothetical protein